MSAQSKPVQQLTPFGHALAGALGGCFASAVVYPLDVAKTRIQANTQENGGKKTKGMFSLLVDILKEEGIAGYYRGFTATMINTFSMQYAYFFFYAFVRLAYIKRRTQPGGKPPALSTAAELFLGAVAGALAQIFTIPVSVIATRQQVGGTKRKVVKQVLVEKPDAEPEWIEQEHYIDDSFWGVGKEIVQEEGVAGLWLGIKPGLVLTVNPAITYGVYERVKSIILVAREKAATASSPASTKLSPGANFVVGALSKTLATVVTYPYIMAKVRIQARGSDAEAAKEEGQTLPPHHAYHHKDSKHPGAIELLTKVYRKKGLVGWYQGMGAQVLKAVLSQALLFMSKDQFEHWTILIMAFLYSVRAKRN